MARSKLRSKAAVKQKALRNRQARMLRALVNGMHFFLYHHALKKDFDDLATEKVLKFLKSAYFDKR